MILFKPIFTPMTLVAAIVTGFMTGWTAHQDLYSHRTAEGIVPFMPGAGYFGADVLPAVDLTTIDARIVVETAATIHAATDSETYAYTEFYNRGGPCTIHMPPVRIEYAASIGLAQFKSYYDKEMVAHELLHCQLGAWHPGWDEIKLKDAMHRKPALPRLQLNMDYTGTDWLLAGDIRQFKRAIRSQP